MNTVIPSAKWLDQNLNPNLKRILSKYLYVFKKGKISTVIKIIQGNPYLVAYTFPS